MSPEPQYPVYGSHHICCPAGVRLTPSGIIFTISSVMTTHRQNFLLLAISEILPSSGLVFTCSADHENIKIPQQFQRFPTSAPCNVPSGLRSLYRDIQNTDSIPVFHPRKYTHSRASYMESQKPSPVFVPAFHLALPRCHSAKSSLRLVLRFTHTIRRHVPCPLSSYGKERPSKIQEKQQPS